jgi:hypothetical protein
MPCEVNKRNSNDVTAWFAEEECLKQLAANAQWFGIEANSYPDFGSETARTRRSFISPSRQKRKSRITGVEAMGGFMVDYTKSNVNRIAQGFFFADAREIATTAPLSAQLDRVIAAVATGSTYDIASAAPFAAGHLVLSSGFVNVANNGVKLVSAVGETGDPYLTTDVAVFIALDRSTDMGVDMGAGTTRLQKAQADLGEVIDAIEARANVLGVRVDLVLCLWGNAAAVTVYADADASDYIAAKAAINAITASGVANFHTPLNAATTYFGTTNPNPGDGSRKDFVFFVTQGTPEGATLTTATTNNADLIGRAGVFAGEAAVEIYGVNVDNATITSTLAIDNTDGDSVPNQTASLSTFIIRNTLRGGLQEVAGATAVQLTVSPAVVDEGYSVADPYALELQTVGYQFASGDISLAVTGEIPALISTVADFTTYANLIPGAWVFIGGDDVATRFANNVGYARIGSVSANALVFDEATFAAVTEAGTGKTLRLFVGTILRNESAVSLIKSRSYQLERYLGEDADGNDNAEYLIGAVPNEMKLTLPLEDKYTLDFGFVASDTEYRDGMTEDQQIKTGLRFAAPDEDAFNSATDIYRQRLSINDPTKANKLPLFGFVTEGEISVANGATANKGQGVLGAFSYQFGDFEVSGTLTAYFTTVASLRAIRSNADNMNFGFNTILAFDNAGAIFDIPSLAVDGSKLSIEKDAAIMLPVKLDANQTATNGYTLLYQSFAYLPDLAMPR